MTPYLLLEIVQSHHDVRIPQKKKQSATHKTGKKRGAGDRFFVSFLAVHYRSEIDDESALSLYLYVFPTFVRTSEMRA